MRQTWLLAAAALLVLHSTTIAGTNFLVILADDLGYGDLGCYGNPVIQSPRIDALASEGLRFTDAYSGSPVCSPSRACLLTGRFAQRVGIHNWIGYGSPMHLRRSELTIATLLKRAGYATCHVGKWHLNGSLTDPDQPDPGDHGFDYWFATQNNALPSHKNPDNFVRNGKPVGKLTGYAGLLVAGEAIHWLKNVWDKERPFFLYVCFHEPHEPIATAPRFQQLYRMFPEPARREHHGNITQLDFAVGMLLDALRDLGQEDNTFVYFTSDNGPAITAAHPYGSAGPLRAKKAHLYEGGIRVPGIVRWPGHVRPGTTTSVPVGVVDLLPTICDIAGVPLPKDRKIDGTSMLPVFAGKALERNTPLYWQLNPARSVPKVAMRVGDWKILAGIDAEPMPLAADIRARDQEAIKKAPLKGFELYNLREDPGETHDLKEVHPEVFQRLRARLEELYKEIQAETPTWPEWTWPRLEARRIRRGS